MADKVLGRPTDGFHAAERMSGKGENRVGSLSARLLALTLVFAMASVVLIFVPSVSRYRLSYLEDHIDAAHLAIFALEVTPDNMVSKGLADMLLAHVGAHGIVAHLKDRTLMLAPDTLPVADVTYDLRNQGMIEMIGDSLVTFFGTGNRIMRVLGVAPKDKSVTIEALLDEKPLREGMWAFGTRVFALSAVIALITAALLYVALQWLLVVPLRRMTASVIAFRNNPEDASRIMPLSRRSDEIGVAQRELVTMEETVRQALHQKERLAALGTAVGKINHDLRGILSTARLMSDSLVNSESPEVKRVIPVLLGAIDRAVALCTATLGFTREGASSLRKSHFDLAGLVDEVARAIGHRENGFDLVNKVPTGLTAAGDRNQLLRALENLARNAAESGASRCTVSASNSSEALLIEITDNGPGLPPKARDNLFRPFAGSARPGGTGLGLAIAREVMRAHGGEIELKKSDAQGTTFRLTLPAD
jgi:signal transduction histidine kinase